MEKEKEAAQKHHSAVLMLKFFAKSLTREQEIGIFWRLAGKATKLVHNNQEKPYMFHFSPENPSDGLYGLYVSSLDPDIIEAFISSVRGLIEAGEAVDVQGLKVRPVDVFPVKDLDYIGEKVCLVTKTGCCVCKRIRTKAGKRSRYYLDPKKEGDVKEWKEIVARKLVSRAKMFMNTDVDVSEGGVHIDILDTEPREFVSYKSANLPTDKVLIEISAPPPVIFAAIYGGIGSHTGAGFGAVRIAKKQLERGASA